MDKNKVIKYFRQLTKEAAELPSPGDGGAEDRPVHDNDSGNILNFLDKGTDPSALDTEGMPEEVGSVVDRIKEEITAYANELKRFADRLINPQNPGAILTKLADRQIATTPEFKNAAEDVAKQLKKAQPAILTAASALDTLATMAPTRRDQRKEADQAAAAAAAGSGSATY